MRAIALLVLAAGLAACGAPDPCDGTSGACIALTVRSATVREVDALQITAFGETLPSTGSRARLPILVALVPPSGASGTQSISAVGQLAGASVGSGVTSVTVGSGHVAASIELTMGSSPCGDTSSDAHNCGSCGNDCALLPHVQSGATVSCSGGSCVIPAASCSPGFAHCSTSGNDGCEADLSSPAHCGSCTPCSGSMLCAASSGSYSCQGSCTLPTPDQCGASCVDLQSNPQHCKTCDTVCTYPHAGATCNQGACQMGSCDAGYKDCMNGTADGCETNVMGSDVNNCGGCGTPCKVGQVCATGACKDNVVTCNSPGVSCKQAGCYQSGRYAVSPSGGITVDINNGRRLWTRNAFAGSGRSAASSSCTTLNLEGINGWRLPTYAELQPLQYMTGGLQGCPTCAPAIDQAAFPNVTASDEYWTSDYNSTKGGYDTPNFCDGRNNYFDPGTGPLPFLCTHDPT